MKPSSRHSVIKLTGERLGPWGHLREAAGNIFVAYYLIGRDLKVRYRQTVLGAVWVLIQPIALALVLAIFLGRFARVPSDGIPYGAFAISGLVAWTYLAAATEAGANSFVSDAHLVTKVYVPRLLIPASAGLSYAVDLVIGCLVALAYAVLSGIRPSGAWALLPIAISWCIILACAAGTLFGSLNVKYRDVRAGVRFGLQAWLFLSPVAYSWSVVPDRFHFIYGLNPAAGPISMLRWTIVGGQSPPLTLLAASATTTLAVAVLALQIFNRLERAFADAI